MKNIGELALQYGWAIALLGGMHHASWNRGGGWCVYSDIPLAIKHLLTVDRAKKFMVIDLDAHQGNGMERDKLDNMITEDVYILDMYNEGIYPMDDYAKQAIDVKIELYGNTGDKVYLKRLTKGLEKAFAKFQPDIIFYNAGSDILAGDPMGGLNVTLEGLIKRDELVFQYALVTPYEKMNLI
jgi:histone deacetylase 11